MCSRLVLAEPSKIPYHFNITGQFNPIPNYNAAPGQILPVIIQDENGNNHLEPMRWGLIPGWARDSSIGFKMINAKANVLDEKPSYKALFRHKRCIVTVSGFYEWKREGKNRIPHYITHTQEDMLFIAGLYDIWVDPTGAIHTTFTIITTRPNEMIGEIHDHMPAILDKQNHNFWLNPEILNIKALRNLLRPYPSEKLKAHIVSNRVNSPRVNDETLIIPNGDGKISK
jgi:putative SOS response-associated peptidase YedK